MARKFLNQNEKKRAEARLKKTEGRLLLVRGARGLALAVRARSLLS